MRKDIAIIESEYLVLQNQIKVFKIDINNNLNTIIIVVNNKSALNITTTVLQLTKLILNS